MRLFVNHTPDSSDSINKGSRPASMWLVANTTRLLELIDQIHQSLSRAGPQTQAVRSANQQDHPELRDNYSFYTNQIPCRPEGMFVDELLASLTANPRDWDTSHGFITWLFPTREIGFNLEAQPLQLHEAQKTARKAPRSQRSKLCQLRHAASRPLPLPLVL
ncbi:unnamed protein product [Darwinula stevensoni]|uniref:Opioid growth factor receptor (OGFr) conserved domain-containing protein n=1 Tax=Darwinula stevensoni TaxID=69355 RepID=A0A7R9FR33_9CRUS|nr:unnamed protein product [Darwinula stevensoni]CAG0900547.1 unnamed protein product [Darwinula stevensoni]